MKQSYKKLIFDFDIPEHFFDIMALSQGNNDLVMFCDCGEGKNHISCSFENVLAYQFHEEFSHPFMKQAKSESVPPYSGEGKWYYPALEILNSNWLAKFSDIQTMSALKYEIKHYQFLSGSNILDVLFFGEF